MGALPEETNLAYFVLDFDYFDNEDPATCLNEMMYEATKMGEDISDYGHILSSGYVELDNKNRPIADLKRKIVETIWNDDRFTRDDLKDIANMLLKEVNNG